MEGEKVGFLLVDKPLGMTSHDVVDHIREITGERRVGHGGTLDPMASGLLLVAVGREATKKLGVVSRGTSKTYLAEICLGEERETDDSEGRIIVKAKGVLPPGQGEIEMVVNQFVGKKMQVPPAYSAVKIGGKPAHRLMREGKKVVLKPRKIVIYEMKLLDYRYPIVKLLTRVSSGTYIRALARDMGRQLGIGAYLRGLRRTKIGKYLLEQSVSLQRLNSENWMKFMI